MEPEIQRRSSWGIAQDKWLPDRRKGRKSLRTPGLQLYSWPKHSSQHIHNSSVSLPEERGLWPTKASWRKPWRYIFKPVALKTSAGDCIFRRTHTHVGGPLCLKAAECERAVEECGNCRAVNEVNLGEQGEVRSVLERPAVKTYRCIFWGGRTTVTTVAPLVSQRRTWVPARPALNTLNRSPSVCLSETPGLQEQDELFTFW